MGTNIPASGQLLSLEIVNGCDAVPSATKLLESKSVQGVMSVWDASKTFVEISNLEVDEVPSARTLILLYAADLFFRLHWEIIPALKEGKCVVAAPYIQTGIAFGSILDLPPKWVEQVFRFAPPSSESFQVTGADSVALGAASAGFVEYCSGVFKRDLRREFARYFEKLQQV